MVSSTYLHLVDVGGMVPTTAEVTGSFAAAIWNEPLILCRLDPHTVSPVGGVVAATTFKLSAGGEQKKEDETVVTNMQDKGANCGCKFDTDVI